MTCPHHSPGAAILVAILLSSFRPTSGANNSMAWVEHKHPAGEEKQGASAFLVPASNFTLQFIPEANATYARVPHTVVGGDELIDGAANLQPTFEACAASCSRTPTCIAFGWCNSPNCPVELSGQIVPKNACQLHHQESAEEGKGVDQLGAGNPRLGDTGVRILVNAPAEPPPGYVTFPAQSLQDVYKIPCQGSPIPSQCVLLGQQQELVDACNAMPECKAMVIGPRGWGPWNTPFGELKGSKDPNEKVDPRRGNLNPVTYTLVKASQLMPAEAAAGGGSGGLSAGAVVGIVFGGVALAAVAAATVTVFILRWRRRGVIELKLSGGQSTSSSLGDELVASMGKGGGGSSASTHRMVARLLSEAPSPQWEDVVVPREAVKFSTKNGKAMLLGGGSSGTVFRGVLHEATPCALKVYDFHEDASLPRYFIQEAVMLRRLSHPSVVQFLGVTVTEGRGLLIMELVAGGDLLSALRADAIKHTRDPRQRAYSWYNRGRMIALQIAAGLHYLHSQKALHLDIKSGNILLSRDGSAKLGDVGFSRLMQHSHVSSLEGRFGTFNWCAPEVLLGGRATEKSDVYSFGIVLWEIITGLQPVRGLIHEPESPTACPREVAELQASCVQQEPSLRPTMEEVVRVLRSLAQSGTRPTPEQVPKESLAPELATAAPEVVVEIAAPEAPGDQVAALHAAPPEAEHKAEQQQGRVSGSSSSNQLISYPSDAEPTRVCSLGSRSSSNADSAAVATEAATAAAAPAIARQAIKVRGAVEGQDWAEPPQPPSPTGVASMHGTTSIDTSAAGNSLRLVDSAAGSAVLRQSQQQEQQQQQQWLQGHPYPGVQLPKQTIVSPFAAQQR